MSRNEPFSYARKLKIFIIVLCCLPVIGIAMMIFLPTPPNGVTVTLVPREENSTVDFEPLIEEIADPTGEYSEEIHRAMIELVGDVKKTYSIAPAVIATENKVFFVSPFTNGVENNIGVELFVFEYSYGHYDEEDFASVLVNDIDLSTLTACGENEHYGLMNVTVSCCARYLFNYDYINCTVSDFTGTEKLVDINKIELDLSEDSITDRLVNTVYAEAAVSTNDYGLIAAENIEIISRVVPGGFKNINNGIYDKNATSDNAEKGAYLRVKTAEEFSDLQGIVFNIINVEKDRFEEEITYPSFKIDMKIYYTNIESK